MDQVTLAETQMADELLTAMKRLEELTQAVPKTFVGGQAAGACQVARDAIWTAIIGLNVAGNGTGRFATDLHLKRVSQ